MHIRASGTSLSDYPDIYAREYCRGHRVNGLLNSRLICNSIVKWVRLQGKP